MYTRFEPVEFDPAKARRNLLLHGVSFGDAEVALYDPRALTIEDADAMGEQRFICLGIDSLGRLLVVVYTQRDNKTRIISARKASRGETDRYHAKDI